MSDFDWRLLGEDPETGLPLHIPFSHNADCQGPTEPETPHHWSCWCPAGDECPLGRAMKAAGTTAELLMLRDYANRASTQLDGVLRATSGPTSGPLPSGDSDARPSL